MDLAIMALWAAVLVVSVLIFLWFPAREKSLLGDADPEEDPYPDPGPREPHDD